MSISSRRGDSGETDLLFGCRIPKSHPRIHALGAVDELNAALGLVRVAAAREEVRKLAAQAQEWLIGLMGDLASPPGEESRVKRDDPRRIDEAKIAWLDSWVARLESAGVVVTQDWALPGAKGVLSGAFADMARAVCRRAERAVVDLVDTPQTVGNPCIIPFLNRLSDVLWLVARWEEMPQQGEGE